MRIGLAINPTSGRGRGASDGQAVRDELAAYPIDIVELSGATADECLARARLAVAEHQIDALIAVGGDGMVHLAVNAVARTGIPLGIVAVGSGNDIAREFHLPVKRIPQSVHQIMTCLYGNRQRPTDIIAIDGEHGRTYALAVVSAGIDAEINRRTNHLSWPKGNLRYVRAALASLRHYPLYGIAVSIDGRKHSGPLTLAAIANTRFIGGGMAIAPSAKTNDGVLQVVLGCAPHRMTLLRLLPLVYTGRHTRSKLVHVLTGAHVRVEADTRYGDLPPRAMADGEEIGDLPLDIHCIEAGIDLLI